MAASATKTDAGPAIVYIADCDETPENDVRGGPCTLMHVNVDNSLNDALTYLKLYNALAPSVGTTVPEEIIQVDNEEDLSYSLNGGAGLAFETGLSIACVTAGGTAGATGPGAAVLVTVETLE